MSKAKAQGTKHESWLVTEFNDNGYQAKRIAEGGSNDEGDVEATLLNKRWVIEAKARQNLNIQATLGAARRKANAASQEPVPVAVIWKRLVKVAGMKNRQPIDGERIVVCMSLDDFLALLNTKMEENNG